MTDAAACVALSVGTPIVAIAALQEFEPCPSPKLCPAGKG
jgi:hypothetical protein